MNEVTTKSAECIVLDLHDECIVCSIYEDVNKRKVLQSRRYVAVPAHEYLTRINRLARSGALNTSDHTAAEIGQSIVAEFAAHKARYHALLLEELAQ